MSLAMRLKAYAPNGASLGILPAPQSIQAAMVYGDVGGAEIAYPLAGPKASVLGSPCELALEVSYDDGATWTEPNDARFLRLVRKGDSVETPGLVTYSGPGYLWRLSKARVLPEGLLNADGKRPFLSKNVGAIMRTLTQEAQARGALTGMDFSTFDETHDSNGAPWPSVVTLYYEPGLDYLTILLNLAAQGLVDATMVGRSLRLYVGDTVMAGASGATLQKGRDLIEAPYTGTMEGLANFAYLAGDNGASFSRTNGAATAPWGRWETFISQGGVTDTGTMTVLTDSALELSAAERVENTYGLEFAAARSLPFRDYGLGNDVKVRDGVGVPVSLRCRQITLTRDEKGHVGGNVVLNDRFLENEVRQARRVQGITGGSTSDGGSGARPSPTGTDRLAPKAPTGLATSSDAYLDEHGKVWATITVNWVAPTQNADGTALTDLTAYEVYWRLQGDTTWTLFTRTEATTATMGGHFPLTNYEVAVRALDGTGNRSPFSAVASLTTDDDATVPTRPSAPIVTPYLGQLLIRWDGMVDVSGDGVGDAFPPDDMASVEVRINNWDNDPESGLATTVDRITSRTGGSTVATGLAYGTLYRVWLRMVDRSGNTSPWSTITTGVPAKAASGDINSITANQITAGAISAAITVSGRIATALTGARVELNDQGIKSYDSGGALTVDIPVTGGATFSGTIKTGATGARVEVLPVSGGGAVRIYSGYVTETQPGSVSAVVAGSGPTLNGAIYISSPKKSTYEQATLTLQGQDADGATATVFTTGTGDVHVVGTANGTGGGAMFFRNTWAGTPWLSLNRSGTSARVASDAAALVVVAAQQLLLTSSARVTIQAPGQYVEILNELRHSGGPVKFTDTWARGIASAAAVGIGSDGTLYHITSSARYKLEIEDAPLKASAVKALNPRTFLDKREWRENGESVEGLKRHLGLIAEEVAEIEGLGDLIVPRDEQGRPNEVRYDRVALALIPWLREIEARLDALETPQEPVGSAA